MASVKVKYSYEDIEHSWHTVDGETINVDSVMVGSIIAKLKEIHPDYNNITLEDFEQITFNNESSGEPLNSSNNSQDGMNNIATTVDPSVNTPNTSTGQAARQEETEMTFTNHMAWDPRLYRYDEFFEIKDGAGAAIRVPFGSSTIASAFDDLSNTAEVGVLQGLQKSKLISDNSYIGKLLSGKNDSSTGLSDESSGADKKRRSEFAQILDSLPKSEKIITHETKDMENDEKFFGAQSIVNPYSLTKLVGGIGKDTNGQFMPYMYDIRDHRRFYSLQDSKDVLAVSNPTVTLIIHWANSDMWGRTPYAFQDFVYCKYFGLIPNNRLITLRRYPAPTYDNLLFSGMEGTPDGKTKNSTGQTLDDGTKKGTPASGENSQKKVFSPLAYVVTWFGGETGNQLSNLMSFTTGINWGEVKSEIWEVSGDTGEQKEAVIDKLLSDGAPHNNAFGGAEMAQMNNILKGGSFISGKIASFGKFALGFKDGGYGESQAAYMALRGANVDPFRSTFRNRIQGPVNRIDKVKKRDAGIQFSQSLTIKCAYKAKAIGGINPKAALLDVLGNCLEMVSPHAVFWGGGHRFMIQPQLYPFRDGGWRDNFLERIYNGKFLGKDGAISAVLSGVKDAGKSAQSKDFSMDTAKETLGQMAGLLGGAVASVSKILGNVSILDRLSDSITGFGANLGGESVQDAAEKGKALAGNLFKNLDRMWRNTMIASTIQPNITGNGSLLVGEPTGEWHLTIGNPLNPIMVVGNLVCNTMKVTWDDDLGPDDFPEGFTVEYSLDHAMARDNDAIQSMFNRGAGKFYTLPDYMKTSSDMITWVDNFTKNAGTGTTGILKYKSSAADAAAQGWAGDQKYVISKGSQPTNAGNYNTTLITKFNPIDTNARRSVYDRRNGIGTRGIMSVVKSLASTRKLTSN